jgi:hypothetical protein
MEVPLSRASQQAPEENPVLRWHQLYLRFVAHFTREGEGDYPAWNLEEFTAWWSELDLRARSQCEQDFLRGYDAASRAGEEEVATVLEQYSRRALDGLPDRVGGPCSSAS